MNSDTALIITVQFFGIAVFLSEPLFFLFCGLAMVLFMAVSIQERNDQRKVNEAIKRYSPKR